MISRIIPVGILILFVTLTCFATEQAPQSKFTPAKDEAARKYPQIVLYSTSWCPHCKEAKEYFTKNSIPFINRDVELDSKAAGLLTDKYKSQGVPLLVLGVGTGKVVMKGFNPQLFQEALKKVKGN